ncbi:hypothetical protein EFP18_23345 [Burkholderia glumae]|uniref:hypothetical protein n=1 Tax=Burkholderia glumae TaxID=337 RepID=UPI0021641BF5|nr:hypothetical protein [Burkholderia glumae]UVS87020.1 hypothetical protein EFP18_23345 [Burkholderia glumae]
MKERPIIFIAPMVRAILDGRKTQTRRVVKPAPIYGDVDGMFASWMFKKQRGSGHWLYPNARSLVLSECPHGQPGDRLWVRESFWGCEAPGFGDQPCVVYDDEWHGKEYRPAEIRPWARKFGRIPAIHMPRDCSRITLEITGVRVERLHDISEGDAIAEGAVFTDFGIEPPKGSISVDGGRNFHPVVRGTQRNGWHMGDATSHTRCMGSARYAFANFINRLHGGENWNLKGPGLWEANPWVWVIEFKRVEGEKS